MLLVSTRQKEDGAVWGVDSMSEERMGRQVACRATFLPANLIFQESVTEKKMGKQNTSNIGFEKQIWDAACVLRGNLDASEYKSVVLGLIFLKYISDSFEAKYQELLAAGEGDEEDRDEYTYENISSCLLLPAGLA